MTDPLFACPCAPLCCLRRFWRPHWQYVVAPRIDAPPRDFLDDCYAADRAKKVRILRECAAREFRFRHRPIRLDTERD